MPRITLYNSLNGLSCSVDAGKGLRGKAWLDELPRWLKESVEPTALAGLGLGRMANFSAIIDGAKMGTKPLGEAYSTPTFAGVEIFECVPNTLVVGIGNAAATIIPGNVALTIGDPSAPGYAVAGVSGASVLSGSVVVPNHGTSYPAQVLSEVEAYNLSGAALVAGGSIVTVSINGAPFTAAVGAGAATTAETVIAAIQAANWPCRITAVINGGAIDSFRLTTLDTGAASSLTLDGGADDCGSVLFASEIILAAGRRIGWGGPLNDARNMTAALGAPVPGVRPQRRILPGSVTLTTTTAVGVTVATDDRAGVLSDILGTSLGTINYTTGATVMTWIAAPAALANVVATFKSLWPINLHDEVRCPETGMEIAIRLK